MRCEYTSIIVAAATIGAAGMTAGAEPDDDPSMATTVLCGDRVQGVTIDPAGDVDFYSITLQAGQLLIVDIDADSLGSSLDSFVRLLDPDSNMLAENDDDEIGGGGFTFDSFLVFCIPDTISEATEFFIEVSGVSDSTGSYEMLVRCQPSCATCCDLGGGVPSDRLCLSIDDCVELFGGKLGDPCPVGVADEDLTCGDIAPPCTGDDSDNDGLTDDCDNCVLIANVDQTDTDADGFGDACDPDLNNDCSVGLLDFGPWLDRFGRANRAGDFTGDGFVGIPDFGVFLSFFQGSPGPSGLRPDCP